MVVTKRVFALTAALLCAPGIGEEAAASTLQGQEIKRLITGKRIYLQTPLGGEFPLHYQRNGMVDGSGEALGLGRFMAPTDQGKWWIAGDRLCQQWQEWYDGKRHCFTLKKSDGALLRWRRDDGLEGLARIGK